MLAQIRMFSVRRMTLFAAVPLALAGFAWLLSAEDTTPPGFQAYRLQQATAADIVPQLDSMLSGEGAPYEIVVDRSGNRILVQGGETTQRLARELIQAMDRPLAKPAKPQSPPAAAKVAVVRSYQVDQSQLDRTLAELRKRFPASNGTRIAADPRTSQLLVVAAEEEQRKIAQALQASGAAPTQAPPATPTASPLSTALKNIPARELEDGLTRLLGQRLTRATTNDGQVTVMSLVTDAGTQPVLQVNRQTNSVSYLGSAQSAQNWQRVVQALDRPRDAASQTDLVPLSRADPQKVHRAVSLMQTGRDAAEGATAQLASTTVAQAPAAAPATPQPAAAPPAAGVMPEAATPPPGAEPPAGAAPPGQAGEETGTVEEGGLIGPVQIEYIEGLDAMVIRGHKRDVERVKKIINDIISASVETEPQIEIVHMKHVGCQVLGTLLTTVYTDILSTRQGRVSIQALVKPNALLLIGRPESVKVVMGLIEKLDQPSKPEAQFEVFRLKHISSTDVQEAIQRFFVDRLGQLQQQGVVSTLTGGATGGASRPGLGTRVNVVAIYRTNSLIVQASPTDMEEVRRMITELDVESSEAANELKIFRLKNALASDVGPVLQDALNWQLIGSRTPLGATRTGTFGAVGQTFGQQEERARLRSAILTFMTVDAKNGKKVLESGLLSDVRVTVDTNSNSLVVTGPAKSMGLIEALITELDRLPNAQAQIKVFTVVNGDASRLSSMLQQLLGQQQQSTTQAFNTLFGQGAINPFLAAGMQSAAATGESSLVPIRFGVDQRTNSIIATGSEGDLGVVEAILLRLDEQSLREHKTMVYWLSNSPASDVATALNQWITQRTSVFNAQLQISPESPDIQWNRRIIVVPEAISNSIIISAAPEFFDEVKHVIESLDRKPPLIKIDVLIAEVVLSKDFEFGAEWGLQDSLLYDRTYVNPSNTSQYGTRPGFNFNNLPFGDTGGTAARENNVLGQGLTSFGVGRVSQLGYGGLVLAASSDAVSALIRALEEEGRAQVLSRPTVTTLDKQPAFVNVGATVSRLAGTTQNVNTTTADVEDVETGLIVGVTPQITPEGLIVMEVDAQKSKLSNTEFVELPAGQGETFRQYNIDKVQAQTTIAARSGQTIVFAGLIQTDKANITRGIPFLSDIPVVGTLFEFVQETETRRELLIVMTPHIIRSDDDTDRIRMAESERMSWCLADVVSLYGDVGFTSRPGNWCGCLTDVPTIFPDANPTGAEPVPATLPGNGGPGDPMLPAPAPAGNRRIGELEPSQPPPQSVPAPQPVSNTGYQSAAPEAGYPGAMLRYEGTNQVPQTQPPGPYPPTVSPEEMDPYTPARRLPPGP